MYIYYISLTRSLIITDCNLIFIILCVHFDHVNASFNVYSNNISEK